MGQVQFLSISPIAGNKKGVVFGYEGTELAGGRTSPVFAVSTNPNSVTTSTFKVLFIFAATPYTFLELVDVELATKNRTLRSSVRNKLWFSHGLASVLLIDPADKELAAVLSYVQADGVNWELWEVDDGILSSCSNSAPLYSGSYPDLRDASALDVELQSDIAELSACLRLAYYRCSIYGRDLIAIIDSSYDTANKLIRALLKIAAAVSKLAVIDLDSETRRHKLQQSYNRLRSEIIQINAALSYTISQWFSGCIPIIEHECQIRRESLLGVGTAYRGVAATLYTVETVFGKAAVESRIKDPNLNRPESGFDTFIRDPDKPRAPWGKIGIDTISIPANKPVRHLLVNFSARRGFRESPHYITVPLETIYHGATASWSLMTFSHEIVHAHVRAVLAAIFWSDGKASDPELPLGMSRSEFERLYNLYRSNASIKDLTYRDSLKLCILNYCVVYTAKSEAIRSNQDPSGLNQMRPVTMPTLEELQKSFVDRHHIVNEIIVHVLDFLYFYDGLRDPYVRLLWMSWCRVPTVLDHVRDYLIRTLSTLTANRADQNQRTKVQFDNAVTYLEQLLVELVEEEPHPVFTAASKLLRDKDQLTIIRRLVFANTYLVDFARLILHSEGLHGALFDDTRRGIGAEEDEAESEDQKIPSYDIQVPGFSTDAVISPIAFIQEMLVRKLGSNADGNQLMYLSAWMLTVCASTQLPSR